MYLSEVLEKYNNKDYELKESRPKKNKFKADYIFDENKSVKWNKEKVIEENEKITNEIKEYDNKRHALQQSLDKDIIIAIEQEFNLNHEQASELFSYGYREWHSGGIHEVISGISDLGNTIKKIIDLKK